MKRVGGRRRFLSGILKDDRVGISCKEPKK